MYGQLAEIEQDQDLREIYRQLAAAEQRHLELWRAQLREVDSVLLLVAQDALASCDATNWAAVADGHLSVRTSSDSLESVKRR
jgi:hypothetical protein